MILDRLPTEHRSIVRRLGSLFSEHGEALALVGGIVRDMLLERQLPNDLDFTTSATPDVTWRLGDAAGAEACFDIGARFGTIGFVFRTGPEDAPVVVEITTYRSESYLDRTRHPAVELGGLLIDDLARRDFTINAIAADATTGELIDPFEGQADLALARIRAVGEPDRRFDEDPLRLLRAGRFVAQLGFYIEEATHAAMVRQARSLARISQERVFAELTKLLCGPFADHGLEVLLETDLFIQAMPELTRFAQEALGDRGTSHREKDLWNHTMKVILQSPSRPAVRWAALLHDAAKPQTRSVDPSGEVHFYGHERAGAELATRLLGRLKADRKLQSSVARIIELHLRPASYERDWTDSAVRRLMLDAGDDLDDLLDLVAADVTSAREHKQREAADRIEALRAHIARLEAEHALDQLRSPLDGTDLMRFFDRAPGRWIAEIKDHLRELVIEGELAPGDRVGAEQIAREWMDRTT